MSESADTTPAASAGVVSWPAVARYFPRTNPDLCILPVPRYDLIYVKNPKAGCTTILQWLDRLQTGELDAELPDIHHQHRLPTIREVGRSNVVGMLAGNAYRFSFVRNPLRRLESAYWDKLVRSGKYRLKAAADLGLPVDPETIVTFEEFLGAVEQQTDLIRMDRHWRPQYVNLMHPLISYDHVGRLESFAADLERIREEAGLPQVPIEATNVSRSSKSADSLYDGRPDLVRRVEQLYAKDFELYGY